MDVAFYATPGPLTALTTSQAERIRQLNLDPTDLCRVVQGLVTPPPDADGGGLTEQRMKERNSRPATDLLQRVLELGDAPLQQPRPADSRIVGTCRHYAVLATAFLRAVEAPARARCGFASYFDPRKKVDHWVVEYWSSLDHRWVRIDPEILDQDRPARAHDLQAGEFLTAGEAWQLVRSGVDDPADYGVAGTENWGPGEIRGNAMRDIAALHKIEMLPWDEWGPMEASYNNETGNDFDELIDQLAIACHDDNHSELDRIYAQLEVPADLIG